MTPSLDELSFESDLAAVLASTAARRWTIEKAGPLGVHVTLSPELAPKEMFQARLVWSTYPGGLPSLKFRDPATGRLDLASAWPRVRGFRPQSFDACVNWCAEGVALHPEWKTDPKWRHDSTGNPLLRTLATLQGEMDIHYEGRA